MGRFQNKSSQMAKERRNVIKVNPYELPEKALAIIANICSAQNMDDTSLIYGLMKHELAKPNKDGDSFDAFTEKKRKDFFNIDFLDDFKWQVYVELADELRAHENTSDTQVVVAGGYSAGKSSFLNRITGADNLLPTGIEPVSMVSTYLYCSKNTNEIVVKGVNLRNAIVLLDKDILQSIQHESKSKIYLASVLNKLFVELPSENLDGFVFIDTPGYNNSDKKNASNGVTDEDTARKALSSGNVLIWVVDAGAGTVPAKDRKMIDYFFEQNENGKVVVLFNKADKKGIAETQRIVDATFKEFASYGDKVIDVLGYSSSENKIYYSARQYDMLRLLFEMKKCGNGNSGVQKILSDIEQMFEDEIEFYKEVVESYKEDRKTRIKQREEFASFLDGEKRGTSNYLEVLSDLLITSYNEVLNAARKLGDSSKKALDCWCNFHNGVMDFENNDHWGTSKILNRAIEQSSRNYDQCVNQHNRAIEYQYYDEDFRKEWFKRIKDQLDRIDSNLQHDYDETVNESKEINAEIQKYESLANAMYNYECIVIDSLKNGIRQYQACAHKVQDVRIQTDNLNIFAAISKGNYAEFTACFANGVKLNEYTSDGYSPVTWAVKEGANDMVVFFMDHEADMFALDQRGYNAFHTAVENGYKDICQLLLDREPELAKTLTANGEDYRSLANKSNFAEWLNQII